MLQCSKCLQTNPNPSHYLRTCNRHQQVKNEPTGYCQGILWPQAYFATGSFVAPSPGHKDLEHNQ